MTKGETIQIMELCLKEPSKYLAFHKLLVELKEEGENRLTIYKAAAELAMKYRELKDEETEDFILEMLDIIDGRCHPNIAIWPDRLNHDK